MFLGILNWMLANAPAFMRPGVGWLIEGLRRITGHISALWNVLGTAAGRLLNAVASLRGQLAGFVATSVNALLWLRNTYIPARLLALQLAIIAVINQAITLAANTTLGLLLALERWVNARLAELGKLTAQILAWASQQLSRIDDLLTALVTGLLHVLSGPVVLAEWLVGAMIDAALRRLYTQRDRIFEWLFTRSHAAALWVARQLEDMIVRLL